MRYTLAGLVKTVTYNHSCSQVGADQLQDALVTHLFADPGHEHIVLHRVEKLCQVAIDSHAVSLADVMTDLVHGIVGRQPLTEAKTCLRKTRIKDRHQYLSNGSESALTCWIRRSRTEGIPRGRVPPVAFGISTRLTGNGL